MAKHTTMKRGQIAFFIFFLSFLRIMMISCPFFILPVQHYSPSVLSLLSHFLCNFFLTSSWHLSRLPPLFLHSAFSCPFFVPFLCLRSILPLLPFVPSSLACHLSILPFFLFSVSPILLSSFLAGILFPSPPFLTFVLLTLLARTFSFSFFLVFHFPVHIYPL